MSAPEHVATARIWDLPTRLLHWTLTLLVLGSFITAEFHWPDIHMPGRDLPHMTLHIWCGYGILVLVLFRIVWGFVGSSTSRFTRFVRGPRAIIAYARGLLRKPGPFVTGHNPLGALMVVALLAALLAQTITGLFTKDEDDFLGIAVGPLHNTVSAEMGTKLSHLHHIGHELIADLVYLHILANLFYWLVRREDLIAAMVSGDRRVPTGEMAMPVDIVSTRRAWIVVGLSAAVVWGALAWLRG